MTATAVPTTGGRLGYARVSTGQQSLDQQLDAITAAGVDPNRVYQDKLSRTSLANSGRAWRRCWITLVPATQLWSWVSIG